MNGQVNSGYNLSTVRNAAIRCSCPGARLIATSRILLASTQRNCLHSPSPRSCKRAAPSLHGFHTTVLSECSFRNRIRRFLFGSSSLQPGTPHALFKATTVSGGSGAYTVSADGNRFVMNTVLPQSITETLTLIMNWPADLKP